MNPTEETERSSLLPPKKRKNSLTLLFEQPQPETAALNNNPSDGSPAKDHESPPRRHPFFFSWMNHSIFSCTPQELQNTFVGSTVFLLYQVVFCLAQAATITRPHATHSSTGVMAQMAALGIMTSGPVFLWELADQVPAIYPASDLFLAPFLAGLAQSIDEVLWKHGMEDNDQVFLATFGLLLSVGFMLSGLLCVLAARVKLANLGAFLPYSVLCGFFTTIGVLMWTLGFSVDVGDKVGPVVMSADWNLIRYALIHHIPSCCVGVCMHLSGPKNPLFVILLVCCTVLGSYLLLWATGTTLAEAQTQNWFFSADDLVPQYPTLSLKDYALPAPFGVWVSVWRGDVFWEAFLAGMPMMMALVLLYLVRCSLHSAALKKNIPKVTRKPEHTTTHDFSSQNGGVPVSLQSSNGGRSNSTRNVTSERKHTNKSNKAPLTLNYILEHGYGYSQLLSGLVGGIAIAPAVAASLTLFKLRAEKPPPQYASCLLVVLFYCSNFTMVQYIPKPAFSSLMVLAGLDMIRTWTYNSYFKTKAKMEWCVGPVLVVLAFTIGVLKAIFVGILVSTFIFAANFYNAGAVKFLGSALTLRSAVERGVRESDWLDLHGDWIQILVVQNYLFFGNCQSLLTYINTMFEDDDEDGDGSNNNMSQDPEIVAPLFLPPKPKYLVLDFSLVSGMDTSAVDIISEIVTLCSETNRCQLYLSGLKPSLKSNLVYAGLKARGRGQWAYTHDMETALAKAEDALLSNEFHLEEQDQEEYLQRKRSNSVVDGFLYALKKIDEQHGLTTAQDLCELATWIKPIELEPGDVLTREEDPGGLYFVETGMLRVQWSLGNTTRHVAHPNYSTLHRASASMMSTDEDSTTRSRQFEEQQTHNSIGHLNARSETIGREMALWKEQHQQLHNNATAHELQSFRLARIGQGWIIGSIEASNGMKKPGVHVCVSACRLHHLPRSAIEQLQESSNPRLAMHLYRALSHLATKRQEMTIEHLGQHLRILNSPVPRLRGRGRAGLALLHHPMAAIAPNV